MAQYEWIVPAPGLAKVKRPGSQMGQDSWVLETLNKKRNGTFVDFGSAHPVTINNTWILETEYNWTGISIDLGLPTTATWNTWENPEDYKAYWNAIRSTPVITGNALEMDYLKLFKENNLPKVIDYLTIDLDPPQASFECLLRIPFAKYQFNTITFEHMWYYDKTTQEPSREFLQKLGYRWIKCVEGNDDFYIYESVTDGGIPQ